MKPLNFDDFYANLGTGYDTMTRDSGRWDAVKEIYKKLLPTMDVRFVVDDLRVAGEEQQVFIRFYDFASDILRSDFNPDKSNDIVIFAVNA